MAMKKYRKFKFTLGIIVVLVLILYLLVYLINYSSQILALILSQLGNTVDKNNFINIDGLTFLALFLSMIGIAVSIILTYVVFNTSKNKTNDEFNNFREIAYIQTLSSLEMIFRSKFTSIQSVDKYIHDSYRFKPLFADQEFQLLLKIWESILSIKSLNGELRMEKVKDHNHLLFHPIVTLLKREYPQLLIQASDVTALLNKETISILNKLNPLTEKSIIYSSRLYGSGDVFLCFENIENVEMIKVLNNDGKPVYEGTLHDATKFSGFGKITAPFNREISQKHSVHSYYIGQLINGVPSGIGVEYAKRTSVELKSDKFVKNEFIENEDKEIVLKDGTWEYGEFTSGNLFHVRMIDNLKPELPIMHAMQDEEFINSNEMNADDDVLVIIGELSLHNQIYNVEKISSIVEIDYKKRMDKAVKSMNRSMSHIQNLVKF